LKKLFRNGCNLTRHCRMLPVRTELSVFLWRFSSDIHFLLNCYTWLKITALLPLYTSSNLTRKLIAESRLATKIKNKRIPCAGQRILQRLPNLEVSCCNVIKIYYYPIIVTYWPALQWCVTCKDCVANILCLWLCNVRHAESIHRPHKNCPRAACGQHASVWTTLS